jgi:drug/metabolite transporter (DMT)-like permease
VSSPEMPVPSAATPEARAAEAATATNATKGFTTMLIAMILLSVGLAAIAQLALKHGMNRVNDVLAPERFSFNAASFKVVVTEAFVWGGLFLFGLSALVWLVVLSRASLSFAYPFAALTYVLILVFDTFVLDEQVPALRWGGVAFIAVGIFLVSRTPHA